MNFSDHINEIKEFNFQSLDINLIGSWPLFIRLFLFVVFFISLLVASWFFYVSDRYKSIDSLKIKEIELRTFFETRYPESSNLQEYHLQMVRIDKMFNELLSLLPVETEIPLLLKEIDNAVVASGLVVEEIKLLPELNKDYYVELPIQITLEGNYHNIGFFVARIASMSRIVTLHNVILTPLNDARIRINVLAKTYRNKN